MSKFMNQFQNDIVKDAVLEKEKNDLRYTSACLLDKMDRDLVKIMKSPTVLDYDDYYDC